MLRAPWGCEHELGCAVVRGGMPHGLCQARALRARRRHGVRAKELGDGRRDLPGPSGGWWRGPSPMPPHPADVARAAQLVAGAERVVVLAGLGAVEAGAGAACRALAARTGGLLSTTLPARGLFHDDP